MASLNKKDFTDKQIEADAQSVAPPSYRETVEDYEPASPNSSRSYHHEAHEDTYPAGPSTHPQAEPAVVNTVAQSFVRNLFSPGSAVSKRSVVKTAIEEERRKQKMNFLEKEIAYEKELRDLKEKLYSRDGFIQNQARKHNRQVRELQAQLNAEREGAELNAKEAFKRGLAVGRGRVPGGLGVEEPRAAAAGPEGKWWPEAEEEEDLRAWEKKQEERRERESEQLRRLVDELMEELAELKREMVKRDFVDGETVEEESVKRVGD